MGKPLVARLQAQGHQLTLFTMINAVPEGVKHLRGDRSNDEDLQALQGQCYDVIKGSGRKLDDSRRAGDHRRSQPPFRLRELGRVYAASELWPLTEASPRPPEPPRR